MKGDASTKALTWVNHWTGGDIGEEGVKFIHDGILKGARGIANMSVDSLRRLYTRTLNSVSLTVGPISKGVDTIE